MFAIPRVEGEYIEPNCVGGWQVAIARDGAVAERKLSIQRSHAIRYVGCLITNVVRATGASVVVIQRELSSRMQTWTIKYVWPGIVNLMMETW